MHKIIVAIPLLFALSSCNRTTERAKYEDPRLKPMWEAAAAVDREALGFTPIERNAQIILDAVPNTDHVMLHVYGTTSRIIWFRKLGDGYKWTGEFEIHKGPTQYESVDGLTYEEIDISYDSEDRLGFPTNKPHIIYWGPDSSPLSGKLLRVEDIREVIKKWDEKKKSESARVK